MIDTDKARQMGALACACNLDRDTNPFDPDKNPNAHEAWDGGFSDEMASWRAQRRADIADQYGDEAADNFD